MAERDTTPFEIIGRKLDRHCISQDDLDKKFAHLSSHVSQNQKIVIEPNAKKRIRKHFDHFTRHFDGVAL